MAMKKRNPSQITSRRKSAGLTMIELMVAIVIGLIVALVVTGSVLTMGRQFKILGSNVASQGSAQIALSLLDAAGRSAGAGFYSGGRLICPTWNAWNGSDVVSDGAAFMAVRIVNGGSNTASDTLVFTGPSAMGALSAAPVLDSTAAGAVVKVGKTGGLAANDLALIGVPGSAQPCTLFQVTAAPVDSASCGGNATACQDVTRAVNGTINPAAGTFATNPTFGFSTASVDTSPAVVSRVGTTATGFRQDAFGVQCNSLVRFNAFVNATAPACTAAPLAFGTGVDAIATDVVLMHAQYGISTSAASDIVTSWVNASGATWGNIPTAGNVARIKSVRVVLVSRSKESEGTQVSTACTNAGGVSNTGPCSFQDAAAPVIDLSATTVAAGKTWQNYRYRVHQAVIPLRNVIWSDS
jgi:type IV pilus assembly protein PilW